MTLNVSARAKTAELADDPAPGGTPPAPDARGRIADEVLDELTASPRDRMGIFRTWHRGALSLVHLNVLTALQAAGPLSMRHLAETLDVSQASATGIVERMERRGLVERCHDLDDRRLVVVHLTDAGRAIFRDLQGHRRERLALLLGELSEGELSGFLAGVRALRAAGLRLFGERELAGHDAGPGSGPAPAAGTDEPWRAGPTGGRTA